MIPKAARDPREYERPFVAFPSARAAFRAALAHVAAADRGGVLLPAYVGWSPREGSGIFDPVRELGVPFTFYRVTERLNIDLDDLRAKLATRRPRVLLLVHYFGFPDPGLNTAVALGREYSAFVLEDEAHAMLTDFVGGACGRLGDASLVSLHKLLPVESGGGLVVNPNGRDECADITAAADLPSPWEFDLARLSARRRENAYLLKELLTPLHERIDPLWDIPPAVVPQTLPVIVRTTSRDVLYERMNEAGFGVVSLYHTLVPEISKDEFPDSFRIARQILNLPVHEAATPESLEQMVDVLDRLTRP